MLPQKKERKKERIFMKTRRNLILNEAKGHCYISKNEQAKRRSNHGMEWNTKQYTARINEEESERKKNYVNSPNYL